MKEQGRIAERGKIQQEQKTNKVCSYTEAARRAADKIWEDIQKDRQSEFETDE